MQHETFKNEYTVPCRKLLLEICFSFIHSYAKYVGRMESKNKFFSPMNLMFNHSVNHLS